MPLRLTATSKSDPGLVRERNEDSALTQVTPGPQEDMALLVVADGMGGYLAGDRASALAVQVIRDELEPLFRPTSATPTIRLRPHAENVVNTAGTSEEDRTTIVLPETAQSEHYGNFITRAVRQANETIVTYGLAHREAKGLGSTVTLAVIARGRAYFANVGDSRSYLFRDGTLRQITRDHSLVAKLVEGGDLDPDDIYSHPKRNLIYRSLGSTNEELPVDLFEEELQPGDMLMLCSDGLWEKVRAPEIVAILKGEADPDRQCAQLIQRANDHGGEDNITVVLARFGSRDAEAKPANTAFDEVATQPMVAEPPTEEAPPEEIV